jgi:hypothetical protein
MTSRDPYSPSGESLDFLYQYGSDATVEQDQWESVYDGLIETMKREASGTPMTTVQNLLIERIAYTYVDMRRKEATMTMRDRKEYTALWVSMTTEFNKLLKTTEDQRLEDFKISTIDIFMSELDSIPDPDIRQRLLLSVKEKFAALESN